MEQSKCDARTHQPGANPEAAVKLRRHPSRQRRSRSRSRWPVGGGASAYPAETLLVHRAESIPAIHPGRRLTYRCCANPNAGKTRRTGSLDQTSIPRTSAQTRRLAVCRSPLTAAACQCPTPPNQATTPAPLFRQSACQPVTKTITHHHLVRQANQATKFAAADVLRPRLQRDAIGNQLLYRNSVFAGLATDRDAVCGVFGHGGPVRDRHFLHNISAIIVHTAFDESIDVVKNQAIPSQTRLL